MQEPVQSSMARSEVLSMTGHKRADSWPHWSPLQHPEQSRMHEQNLGTSIQGATGSKQGAQARATTRSHPNASGSCACSAIPCTRTMPFLYAPALSCCTNQMELQLPQGMLQANSHQELSWALHMSQAGAPSWPLLSLRLDMRYWVPHAPHRLWIGKSTHHRMTA